MKSTIKIYLFFFVQLLWFQNNVAQPIKLNKGFPLKLKSNAQLARSQSSLSDFDVLHYRLDLRFPLNTRQFNGKATLDILACRNGLNEIELNSVNLNIDSVSVPGNSAAWNEADGLLHIGLAKAYAQGDNFSVRVVYSAAPNEQGFYFETLCAFTFSEPEWARYWFPCRDVPWDKATAELITTVPKGVTVASIGLLKSRTISADGTWETFRWATDYPVATYLMCLNMSRYYARWSDWYVSGQGDSLEIAHFIFQRDSVAAVQKLVHMKDAIAFFSMQFAPYPFEKFGMAEVEPCPFGGMEHQTMVTFNSKWLLADWSYESGFVHELSHMWWGDAVTCTEWADIWLNEGFATYSEALFIEFFYGQDAFRENVRHMITDYFSQAGVDDFSIYNPPEGEIFNYGIVYAKAGMVLHMLRKVVGEEPFWRILREYFKSYCYRNASTDDFRAVCERIYGKSLIQFFQEWIYGKGFPELSYSVLEQPTNSSGVKIILRIQQTQKSEVLFHMPLDIHFAGVQDTVVQIENQQERFVFTLDRQPDSLVIDPDGWMLMTIQRLPSDIREEGEPLGRFILYPSFPNPFNAETTLFYDIPAKPDVSRVTIAVYNLLGEMVRILMDTDRPIGGKYHKLWDGKDALGKSLASGMYVIKMTAGDFTQEQKVVLVR